MSDDQFDVHLTEQQYTELNSAWHEYLMFDGIDPTSRDHVDFFAWLDADDEEEPEYSIPEIEAFLREKARREGIAFLPADEAEGL